IAGMEAGMHTILVLSGISSAEGIRRFPFRPNEIVDGVHELLDVPLEARSELGADTTGSALASTRRWRAAPSPTHMSPAGGSTTKTSHESKRIHPQVTRGPAPKPPNSRHSTRHGRADCPASFTPLRRSLQGRRQSHRRVHIAASQLPLLPVLMRQIMTGSLVVG